MKTLQKKEIEDGKFSRELLRARSEFPAGFSPRSQKQKLAAKRRAAAPTFR